MTTVELLLSRLSDEIRQKVGTAGIVEDRGVGLDHEIHVRPLSDGPCPFIVHAQSDDEVTVEFGALSVAHIASKDLDLIGRECRDLIDGILIGAIGETVWVRNDVPCRALARISSRKAGELVFHTRRGLCLKAERRELRYRAYINDGAGSMTNYVDGFE